MLLTNPTTSHSILSFRIVGLSCRVGCGEDEVIKDVVEFHATSSLFYSVFTLFCVSKWPP